jgi:hypothetical protein
LQHIATEFGEWKNAMSVDASLATAPSPARTGDHSEAPKITRRVGQGDGENNVTDERK